MGLAIPPSEGLRRAALEVIDANGLTDARMRITLTGGPSPLGSERGRVTPTLILAASETAAAGAGDADRAVVTVPWPRNERGALAGLKTISYGENVRALAVAKEAGAGEAIFANTRGELCEGTGTNVFVVTGGVLRTPPEESGCLLGVTRALILELADRLAIAGRRGDAAADGRGHRRRGVHQLEHPGAAGHLGRGREPRCRWRRARSRRCWPMPSAGWWLTTSIP